jgi:hypothetical protein
MVMTAHHAEAGMLVKPVSSWGRFYETVSATIYGQNFERVNLKVS